MAPRSVLAAENGVLNAERRTTAPSSSSLSSRAAARPCPHQHPASTTPSADDALRLCGPLTLDAAAPSPAVDGVRARVGGSFSLTRVSGSRRGGEGLHALGGADVRGIDAARANGDEGCRRRGSKMVSRQSRRSASCVA